MKLKSYICFLLIVQFITGPIKAQVRLPQLIRDSMILQRDTKLKLWGWAHPDEKINITINNKKYKTVANDKGNWIVNINPIKAGKPFQINIDASNHIVIHDVLAGDVFLCSGQSNMVHQMGLHRDRYEKEIAECNFPEIRHFWIPTITDLVNKHTDVPLTYWKSANPTDVLNFSAVAFFFAKDLYLKYHVPIGLINASVGGTPIEAWTSEEGLKDFPAISITVQKNKDTSYINNFNRKVSDRQMHSVDDNIDKGIAGSIKWFDTSYVPKGWHNINVPGYWEDQGIRNLHGIVWYRREIDIPATMTGVPARLNLGRIVDADNVYINGVPVGRTTYMYPQRRYQLKPGILIPGKNIIVIQVTNYSGKGGFVPDKPYYLEAGGNKIDLKGYWSYKVGKVFTINPGPGMLSIQNMPTSLYNGMIAPLTNYSIKGILWYQGEANTSNAAEYSKLQPALIYDWRNQWHNDKLPFLFVQLPNFMEVQYSPSESNWALLRESQLKSLSVPYTAMAVAIDLGEWNDIHPDRKKEVGDRLALAAEKLIYGENDVVYSGPTLKSFSIEGNKIRLEFDNTGTGLISNDGEELTQFAIAGEDKKFQWAHATIEGNSVIVWNDKINHPLYVRYAWADNPDGANLFNKEGLPASPFRTDQ